LRRTYQRVVKTLNLLQSEGNGDVFAFAEDKIFVFQGANTEPTMTIDVASVNASKGETAAGQFKAGYLGAIDTFVAMNSGAWLDANTLLVGDGAEGLFTLDFNASKQVKIKK
jgi:hypothetical protein